MDELSKVLENINNMRKNSELNNDTSSTPQHGLTTEDGKMTTQSTSEKKNPSPIDTKKNTWTNDEKHHFAKSFEKIFKIVNSFGKKPEDFEDGIDLFVKVVSQYDFKSIMKALERWIKENSTLPTPADLIALVEPLKEEKKFCKSTFIELCRQRREDLYLTKDERQYIEDFIAEAVKEGIGSDDNYMSEAVKQVEMQDRLYLTAN